MDEPDIPVAVPFPVAFTVDSDEEDASDNEPDEIILPIRPSDLDKVQQKLLKEQGFTEGLGQALSESLSEFALRIWVVDNSGSMANNDGQKLVADTAAGTIRSIP